MAELAGHDGRQLLRDAVARGEAWEAVYRARRLLQVNANDRDAHLALHAFKDMDFTAPGEDGRPELSPLLGFMGKPARAEFVKAAHLIERAEGEVLVSHGDGGDTMFLIIRGEVGVVSPPAPGGQPRLAARLQAGHIVGELAYALHRPRTATLVCLSPVAILAFQPNQLRSVLGDSALFRKVDGRLADHVQRRILRYVCGEVAYLVGKDRQGPLARESEPWELFHDHAELIDLPAPGPATRDDPRLARPGLHLLLSGSLRDEGRAGQALAGERLPILYADFPGLYKSPSPRFAVEQGAKALRLDLAAALGGPSFPADTLRKVVEGVKAALLRQDAPDLAGGADEAFSSQTVLVHYPAPVALAYQRFCRERDAGPRLAKLFLALQATLKYLTFVGLCDLWGCRARSGRPLNLPAASPEFEFLRRQTPMSLGRWAGAVRETARLLDGEPERFVRELPAACRPGGPFDERLVSWIISRRNVREHTDGDVPFEEGECRTMLAEARPRLEEALLHLSFLRSYPLGFLVEGVGPAAGGVRRYHAHSCTGAGAAGRDEATVIEMGEGPAPTGPFLLSADGSRMLFLWPLLMQRVAQQTGRHCVTVFERLTKDARFLSAVHTAAVDHRAGWDVELHAGPAADLSWLGPRLTVPPHVLEAPAGARLAERLRPSGGGELVGRALGPNRLGAMLGRGGFGTVYAAEGPNGERLAVKVLTLHEMSGAFRRFEREFKTLRQAGHHPGIIRCFHFESTLLEGRLYPWYSMEYAAGGDLASRFSPRGPGEPPPWAEALTRAEIVQSFRELAAAVAHLHGLGILHRDLKPGNVLIAEDGSLKLSDFGLVKEIGGDGHSSSGALIGTYRYMAHEQKLSPDVTKAADVYSLGVILAEMATGEWGPRPEGGPPRGVADLPPPLRRYIARCTDPAPEKRPADAGLALDEFEELLRQT